MKYYSINVFNFRVDQADKYTPISSSTITSDGRQVDLGKSYTGGTACRNAAPWLTVTWINATLTN